MRFGFVGGTYISRGGVADEECINFFLETVESQSAMTRGAAYGGMTVGTPKALYGTPGLVVFGALPESPVRGSASQNGRCFVVAGTKVCETFTNGSYTVLGTIASDGNPVSIALSPMQALFVSAGRAYCYSLSGGALTDVTSQLADVPIQCEYSDGYFVVLNQSGKFQFSNLLDGTTWNGLYVDAVSVFPDTPISIIVNHRELWVFGSKHCQPYQDTGSAEIFDVNAPLIEMGTISTFSPVRIDNSVFWVGQDERGALVAWRSNGYTPVRVSTHAVESAFAGYVNVARMVSYSYQDSGHLFWVIYIPGADCTWVYDVTEGLWHKRAAWVNAQYQPHAGWNHVYAFGKHLVGDWNSGNLYDMSLNYYDDAGSAIRRLRRAPTVGDEMKWVYHSNLVIDFETGLGPQPTLYDGNGNPRQPQAMVRWSDNSGRTWSNEHVVNCGFSGQYNTRAIVRRLGRSRYRVYEVSVTDPIQWSIRDAYLEIANAG